MIATLIVSCLLQGAGPQPPARIELLPYDSVQLADPIWQPRTEQLAARTLPHAFENTRAARERLRLCAEFRENGGGPLPEPHRYNTSDLYKVLEAGALLLRIRPDPELRARMDRAIDWIARAQQDDGYLYVPHITGSIRAGEMGERPYSYVLHSHELYNVGHLYEAAVAIARTTGDDRLLRVAEKNARHVERVFFDGDPAYNGGAPVQQAPGHQQIELGLLKLYHHTGEPRYLQLAQRFLDIRGVTFRPDGEGVNAATYAQQHLPVVQQTQAVGHAVRATYMYAAMAEVVACTGRTDYARALDAIWRDLVDGKMHISGGLGAVGGIEGFGPPCVLPNAGAYLETCAAVGNVLFNMRMFTATAETRYVDVAEVALLNHCLAGLGLDGASFFYPNPLEADAGHPMRAAWFGTACCPSNLARLLPQVPGSCYARGGTTVYCLLYAANRATLRIGDTAVQLAQETAYPFDGRISLRVSPETPVAFELAVRIPHWARRSFLPSRLYEPLVSAPPPHLAVNGEAVDIAPQNGFVFLRREWRAGDHIELQLPMPVVAHQSIPEVEANRGRVAFTRGPLLLCAEAVDNGGGAVQRFSVDPIAAARDAEIFQIDDGPLRGLPRVRLVAAEDTADGRRPHELQLVPYFAWSNRDDGSMAVWLRRTDTSDR